MDARARARRVREQVYGVLAETLGYRIIPARADMELANVLERALLNAMADGARHGHGAACLNHASPESLYRKQARRVGAKAKQ